MQRKRPEQSQHSGRRHKDARRRQGTPVRGRRQDLRGEARGKKHNRRKEAAAGTKTHVAAREYPYAAAGTEQTRDAAREHPYAAAGRTWREAKGKSTAGAIEQAAARRAGDEAGSSTARWPQLKHRREEQKQHEKSSAWRIQGPAHN